MKVDVVMERDGHGRLHAYVVQRRPDGVLEKGDDMLRRCVFRNLTLARIECDQRIRKLFVLLDLKEITYTFPPGEKEE